ncbi:Transcriptional regulator, AsnC family [Candidatus Nitrosotalea sp. FS]|uniref:Lrp/AsnC family transcriptional regulator n=1 Tax=Candidatus Nitrosotalea sp. FS TaxID=2341021 RepID=UPI00140BEA9B|nr:Lrp/AsnC ligand binding domain-containing protein [Candidatus Nitrosotalea sp. FS]NHH97592.1 Transcriptional regulator, AsnC family [Candidatus Nitrosotalea sp. FS]
MEKGFVLINCELGAEDYIIEELKTIPEVKNAHVTFGAYDVIAEIQAKNSQEFDTILSQKIRSLSQVMSTMTLKATT